jgi:hypothetical protein
MQAVPGMYAGEDEIIQWCIHHNRQVTVISDNAPLANGALALFGPQGRVVIPVTADTMIAQARLSVQQTGLMLYKTPGHWEKVVGLSKT